jgi:hypothetical protein
MRRAVKDGGQIVFLAECREGGGAPAYFDWIESLRRGTLDLDLRRNFTIAGYIFYASCEVMDKGRGADAYQKFLKRPSRYGGARVFRYAPVAQRVDFTGKDVYIMPYGGYTVPYLQKK